MSRPTPHRRAEYAHARAITTRWMDNDAYGHVNNVVYYSFFDTVVNAWLTVASTDWLTSMATIVDGWMRPVPKAAPLTLPVSLLSRVRA